MTNQAITEVGLTYSFHSRTKLPTLIHASNPADRLAALCRTDITVAARPGTAADVTCRRCLAKLG